MNEAIEASEDFGDILAGASSLVRVCQFPFGDPRDDGFHFCGKNVRIGVPYCDQHLVLCYRSVKKIEGPYIYDSRRGGS